MNLPPASIRSHRKNLAPSSRSTPSFRRAKSMPALSARSKRGSASAHVRAANSLLVVWLISPVAALLALRAVVDGHLGFPSSSYIHFLKAHPPPVSPPARALGF